MFCLSVELLTGRYVATDYADRGEAEWPPHPTRVYSALVATWAEDPDPVTKAALEWLASQPPPALAAGPASKRDVVTVFVPVNDTTVLGDVDKRASQWQAAQAEREALAASPTKAPAKALEKAAKAADAAHTELRRALVAPLRVADSDLVAAHGLFPENRKRMPRAFPSVTPAEPRFALVWGSTPDEQTRFALDALAARVHRIGHSSSLVSLSCPRTAPSITYLPKDDGPLTLRVAPPGQLSQLQEDFALHQGNQPRVLPCAYQRYAPVEDDRAAPIPRSVFGEDWIILRRVDGSRPALPATLAFSRAVRGALLRHGGPTSELLSGHQPDGQPSKAPHLAIVPLPFVGHPHADGELKGVALILPRGAAPAALDPLLRALGAWEQASPNPDALDHPPLVVNLGAAGRLLVKIAEAPATATLRPFTWCQPSTTWVSVTPVALDRFPGDLNRRGPAGAAAWQAAEKIVRAAIARIGLPDPAEVELSRDPPLSGARPTRAHPTYSSHGRPRLHLHVRLRFETPVGGPILLGAGRFFGHGLLRPILNGETTP